MRWLEARSERGAESAEKCAGSVFQADNSSSELGAAFPLSRILLVDLVRLLP